MSRSNHGRIQPRQPLHRPARHGPIRSEVRGRPMQLRMLRQRRLKEALRFRRAERITREQRPVLLAPERDMARRMARSLDQCPLRHLRN